MVEKITLDAHKGQPIYKQIADQLREMILSGKLQPGDRLPPEPQLAENLGINRLTLRKSLQILQSQHLLTQVPGRGTFVNSVSQIKYRIGILMPELNRSDMYLLQIIASVNLALEARDHCDMVLIEVEKGITPEELLQKMLRAKVNGCIALAIITELSSNILESEIFSAIPMVIIGSNIQLGFPTVDLAPDQLEIGFTELIASGHRKIAYVGIDYPTRHYAMRTQNFLELSRKYHLNTPAEYIVNCRNDGQLWFDHGYENAKYLMSLEDTPTAVISNTSSIVYGLWQGLLELGVKIPGDISVIGFDCDKYANPMIASIVQPVEKMVFKCVDILIESFDRQVLPVAQNYTFGLQLYQGKSIQNINISGKG